jgi:hypothetical protein|tara:strand:+ start:202 stop:339 length:138 start_codon:yes stop_codon:yes gene_type:complete
MCEIRVDLSFLLFEEFVETARRKTCWKNEFLKGRWKKRKKPLCPK